MGWGWLSVYWIDCGQSKLKKCRASPVRVLAAKGVMSCARAGQARGAGHLRCLQWPERLQTRLQTQWPRAARLPWCPCSSTARLETHCRAWMVVLTKNGAITTTGGMIVIFECLSFFFPLQHGLPDDEIDAIGKQCVQYSTRRLQTKAMGSKLPSPRQCMVEGYGPSPTGPKRASRLSPSSRPSRLFPWLRLQPFG